ncbi:hypothetical protein [Nocardia vaccinii]|uniref:hypothetical protein n=1 Tax=Nocardia vaccinii TaxID=1822 RepID=UPI00082FEEB4|nr:hypothetical protein [Nocardia vaccinii]
MADYTAGNAGVSIHPDFDKFVEELRADLEAVDARLKVTVEPQTADADTQMEKWRADAGRDMSVRVDADTEQASADLDRWRAEQEANPVKIGVTADEATSKSASNKLKRDLESLKGDLKEAATLNMKVVGVNGAAAAVSDLLAIADAATQASRALALLPAAGGALAFGGISAAIGAHGISDVFKAYTAASADSAQTAVKQRDALNAVAEAQYQVGTAQRAGQTAVRNLTQDEQDLNTAYKDTSRSIRDVNLSLEEQKVNVTDASVAVSEAAKNLQKVQYDPTADADQRQKALDDYQRAVIGQQRAQNKLNDTAQDAAEANRKGIEGSDQVVAAKQKVSDGIQAEADAAHQLSQALIGVQKAEEQAAQSGGQDKIASALAKLSPNARELVADIRALGPAWTDVRIAGQDALTNGLGPAIERLANTQLPAFKAGVVGVDEALNTGLRATLLELSSPGSKANFGEFLTNTVAGFRNASGAAAPFTQAITTLAAAGSRELPAMGQAVDDMATKFDNLILRTTSDGEFDAWMKQGITSARELGQTVEHLGSSVASVFRAAGDGSSVVQSLDNLTGRMAAFLKSGQGQTELGSFFRELRQDGQQLAPLLKDLPGLAQGVVEGFHLWGSVIGAPLHEIAHFLSDHPRLVELAIAAYAGFKTVKPAVDGAKLAIDFLAKSAGGAAEGSGGLGKLKAAGSGLIGLLGNPWTVALSVAAVGFLTFSESADKGSAAIDRFHGQVLQTTQDASAMRKALQSSGGALDTGVIDANTNAIKNYRDALATNAKDMPGVTDYWSAGLAGVSSSWFGGLGKGVAANYSTRKSVDEESQAASAALDKIGLSNDQLSAKITGSKPQFDQLIGQLKGMGSGGEDAAHKLTELRDEWAVDASSVHPVAAAIQDLSDKNRDAANSIDAATNALERQRQGGLTVEDATLKVNEALTAMGTNASTAAGATIDASGAIDTTTSKGQALYQLLNQQLAPAWEQETAAVYKDAIQHGQNADQAQAAAQKKSDAIRDSATKSIEAMGYTQSQADELLKHYQPLAGNFKATFTADTTQATGAVQQLEKLITDSKDRAGNIPGGLQYYAYSLGLPGQYSPGFGTPVTPTPAPGVPSNVAPFFAGAHATGGLLSGPGNGTSDSMVIRASTGEFVESEGAVDTYGVSFFQALNERRIDPKLIAMLPGYATGGQPGSTPASSSTSATASGASNIAAVLALAQSLAGQPYGGALDCSGLISQLALKADGLDPSSGRMATSSEGPWLQALGWKLGTGSGNGVFSVGWIDDPSMPGGGHTAGTLPNGQNIESSGSAGKVLLGGSALGSNASLFTQHAYLNMSSATVNTADGGLGNPAAGTLATPTPGVSSQSVLNPQAAAPAPQSDEQIQLAQDKAAFDQANSQRNAVYANPASTQADKTAADYAYNKAANTVGRDMQNQSAGAATLFSAQGAGQALGIGIGSVIGAAIGASIPGGQGAAVNAGIGGRFGNKFGGELGGALAGGLLNSLGLGGSILSQGNAWNSAFQKGIAASGAASGIAGAGLGAAGYAPQNLPTIVTTTTQQGSPTNPATASYAGTAGTSASAASNAALAHTYVPGGGAQQWLGTVQAILTATGRNPADAGITVEQIQDESGGDPNAVNNYDSNAAAGHPSKGLLQVIDTTFAAYQDARFPGSQTDAAPNIAAALNYVDSKYGGPEKIWPTTGGYADGGWVGGPGGPRSDSVPMLWWGSNGEYLHVTNAAGAQQNAPFLDAMNAGAQFQPLPMPSNYDMSATRGGSGETHYHNDVHVNEPRIMHMGEFMDHMNQQVARSTLGGMSTWPV